MTSLQAIDLGNTSCTLETTGSCAGGTFRKFGSSTSGTIALTPTTGNEYVLKTAEMTGTGSSLNLKIKDSFLRVTEDRGDGHPPGQALLPSN